MSATRMVSVAALILFLVVMRTLLAAQDASGAIRGTVLDSAGGLVVQASIVIANSATGAGSIATSSATGAFDFELLAPADYSALVTAQAMSPQVTPQLHVDVGGTGLLEFHLTIAGAQEKVTVSGAPALVEPQTSTVSTLLEERAVNDFALNARDHHVERIGLVGCDVRTELSHRQHRSVPRFLLVAQ
ncbi:MAG TPA: carboxypeptidase-like regulatory domain-containing protein [Candidatus Sulfotelmatobacter sp.]